MMRVMEETPTARSAWWRSHGQKLVALLLWALLLGGYTLYYQRQGLTVESSLQQLLALFATPYGPLLYLVSFLIRPLLFFSVGILCIMGGMIFGAGASSNLLLALSYTVIGVMVSALISFGIGRFLGNGLIGQTDEATTHLVQRYANRLRRNGFLTVLTMRLILLPFDFVNYLAALVAVDWKAFTLATAIGALPSTIAFVTFGAAIDLSQLATGKMPTLDSKLIVLAAALFGASALLSRWYKGRHPL